MAKCLVIVESPAKVKTIIVRKATRVARDTINRRSLSVIPCVIVRKTGMVPKGFVNVKKDVRQSKAKGRIDSIVAILFVFYRMQNYN